MHTASLSKHGTGGNVFLSFLDIIKSGEADLLTEEEARPDNGNNGHRIFARHYRTTIHYSVSCAYLVPLVLDRKAKDALGFVAGDHVHLGVEPGVLQK